MEKWILVLASYPLIALSQQPSSLKLAEVSVLLTNDKVIYDPSYFVIHWALQVLGIGYRVQGIRYKI